MSLHRYAARRDSNEAELFALARSIGIKIYPLSTPCDALALIGTTWWPVEVKSATGTLTERQERFLAEVEAKGAGVLIWRTRADVLACLENRHAD